MATTCNKRNQGKNIICSYAYFHQARQNPISVLWSQSSFRFWTRGFVSVFVPLLFTLRVSLLSWKLKAKVRNANLGDKIRGVEKTDNLQTHFICSPQRLPTYLSIYPCHTNPVWDKQCCAMCRKGESKVRPRNWSHKVTKEKVIYLFTVYISL